MELFKTFKNPKDLLLVVILILIAGGIFWGIWNHYYHAMPQQVLIITERPSYTSNAELSLAVKDILPNRICFSSCYPYFFERQDKEWVAYDYNNKCDHPDMIESCLEPDYAKFFSILLPSLDPGVHRILIPVAINREVGDFFHKDELYYSNDFIVK